MTIKSFKPPKSIAMMHNEGIALSKAAGVNASVTGFDCALLSDSAELKTEDVNKLKAFFTLNPERPDLAKSDDPTSLMPLIQWMLMGGIAAMEWVMSLNTDKEEDNLPGDKRFSSGNRILKVDESLGLVMGYAIISKQKGEDYFDLHGDHIPEESMLKAAVEFMSGDRIVGDMHQTVEGGSVVFAWPMTTEIAKAFGLETETTGLMIAIKPESQKTLEKFRSGEYNGFSIGGTRIIDEELV